MRRGVENPFGSPPLLAVSDFRQLLAGSEPVAAGTVPSMKRSDV